MFFFSFSFLVLVFFLLLLHLQRREPALQNLRQAAELRPEEPLVWVDLAQLVQSTSHLEALEAYVRAAHLMKKKGAPVSMELHHNIGVLQQLLGDFQEAEESFMQALVASCGSEELAKKQADGEAIQADNVTTCYNLGRLHEQSGRRKEAKQMYEGIIREFPGYSDGESKQTTVKKRVLVFFV
jgi:tetratricopeptide (TPR) repeat protein